MGCSEICSIGVIVMACLEGVEEEEERHMSIVPFEILPYTRCNAWLPASLLHTPFLVGHFDAGWVCGRGGIRLWKA